MRLFRKIPAALALLTVLSLCACGNEDASENSTALSSEPPTAASSETTTSASTTESSSDTDTTVSETAVTTGSETVTSVETTSPPKETATSEITNKTEKTTTSAEKTTTKTTTTAKPQLPESGKIKSQKTAEVYERITVGELFSSSDGEIVNRDDIVDTDEIGDFTITVKRKDGNRIIEETAKYKVADTTEPLLINGGWKVYLDLGETLDLDDYVGYADNYDDSPKLTYTGKVNTDSCGTYPITATVTDGSGNKTSWDLKVIVSDPNEQGGSGGSGGSGGDREPDPGDPFADFTKKYAADGVSFGIDVSKWQGDIDFKAVKAAGADFVIIRVGHCYDDISKDKYFDANLKNAKAAGLKVGVYLYTTATDADEAREHARWIVDQLGGASLEMPIVFDWESFDNFQQYDISIHDLNEVYLAFADEVKKLGFKPMLYGSKNRMNTIWSDEAKAAAPVWLAHYTEQTDYEGDYMMWQASCTGRIAGIDGDVDLDILYN